MTDTQTVKDLYTVLSFICVVIMFLWFSSYFVLQGAGLCTYATIKVTQLVGTLSSRKQSDAVKNG